MPDLRLCPPPPRDDLLRQLRLRLGDLAPGLRLLAEGLLGAESRIDFVASEPDGQVVLVLVGDEGDDLALLARGLAQKAWAEARLRDWLQLAPELGIRPEAGARLWLLSPGFDPQTRAAALALGAEGPQLVVYRSIRDGADVETLLEPLREPRAGPPRPAAGTPASGGFRTGLRDSELGLTPEERREFE